MFSNLADHRALAYAHGRQNRDGIISVRMALLTTRRIWPVLAMSGALGFLCGALLQPTWQVVVEPSQVLAGVVTYPPNSAAATFASGGWTVLHQITALALGSGIREHTLAVIWSGLVGLLSFQALALTALAMGAPRLVATLSPLLIFVSGAARFLPGYPVDILGWPNTWGMVAHGLFLLLLALLALRRHRAAALLLGLFPSVHIGVALWAWLIVGLLARPMRKTWVDDARPMAAWVAAGLAVTMVSGLVHLIWFTVPASAAPDGGAEIMRSIRLHWDSHRLPIEITDVSVIAAIAIAAGCLLWQRHLGRHLAPSTWWLAAGFAAAVALALSADLAMQVLPEDLAAWIARPMPRRLLSLPVLGGMAWIIGLSTGAGAPPAVRMLSGLLLAAIAVVFVRPIGSLPVPSQFIRPLTDAFIDDRVMVAAVLAGTAGLVLTLARRLPATWHRWCDGRPGRVSGRVLQCALVGLAVLTVVEAGVKGGTNTSRILDRSNNTVLDTASRRSGTLVTVAGSQLVQASTRRAVLLDLSLIDVLVYTPAAAAIAEHIVERVYGFTLTQPPPRDDEDGFLGKAAWTARTEDQWRALAVEFDITDVLTPADWSLQLPVVMRDDLHALWTIPRPAASSPR
jgi:hypothetical protein